MANNKKQPEALSRAKGVYKPYKYKNRVQTHQIGYFNNIPDPPEHLRDDGRKYWYSVMNEAVNIHGWIASIDLQLFSTLCFTYDVVCECQRSLKENGLLELDDKGNQRAVPTWKIYMDALDKFKRLSTEFGITPMSRAAVKLAPLNKEPKSDIDDLEI